MSTPSGSIEKADFEAIFGTSDESIFDDFDENKDGLMSDSEWGSYIEALTGQKGPAILDEAMPYWERRARYRLDEKEKYSELESKAARVTEIAIAERKEREEAKKELEEAHSRLNQDEAKVRLD